MVGIVNGEPCLIELPNPVDGRRELNNSALWGIARSYLLVHVQRVASAVPISDSDRDLLRFFIPG